MSRAFDRQAIRSQANCYYLVCLVGMMFLSVRHTNAATEHFAITSDQVMQAMRNRQLPIEGAQVQLAAQVNSASAQPMLEVNMVNAIDAHTAQIRVACQAHAECLPFYAMVRWTEKPGVASAQTVAQTFAAGKKQGVPGSPAVAALEKELRVGTHATLVIDQERIHIRLPVICMQAGGIGDKVRVTTANHRQTFDAVIVNGAELKGNL